MVWLWLLAGASSPRPRTSHVDPEHETLTVYRWTPDGYVVALTAGRADRHVRAEPFEAIAIDVGLFFGDDPV
jgi:hypothetical protein